MPITFTIEHEVVFTTARGILSYADILGHIAAKRKAGITTLPELFDTIDVTLDLSTDELKSIASEVTKSLDGKAPGKTAVVTNSAFLFGLARSYGELTKETNPDFGVFDEYEEARVWIFDRPSTTN
jgi:hypothetical protein